MNATAGGFNYDYILRSLIACCQPHRYLSMADAMFARLGGQSA
jgi:hypothetical protein